ncbi:MAG: F0F1 ATP synthase subunit B [Candidatus Marinimicrobia bacterium]|jgi:F-type H+-transporting ATPase subunit b|nr:ATP synthase F0 subunit B [Candidatus Neomarinimicrobiota bacterium]MDP6457368.1 F0F1 ATP synthase subunit B [Candidatus Neomarinimicrobiota bacterium]MDP6593510.1 F0F1 ATP synthase subunit B [Candidatus Neomarinimicrobiota bacterium]MDP6836320.1 F0F1 ATP synthase subunit B [Candidatus Neomarinimicrobiota bacterium]MDP6966506.1 F0F1 ATP synthase subunit B [Candidatus Neomarinimicrobiota bacterium]|tara:strand:- start:7513 stop:8019 length:507 start_codon:yes stop_codon:yes gene_type:complete
MENPLVRIEPGLFIWTIVTFLALLGVLARFVWRPLMDALERRENKIRESLENAEKAKIELERLQHESEEIVAGARGEAQTIVAEGKAAAKKMKDDILQAARDKATGIIDQAGKQIEVEKDKALVEIKAEVVDLSIQVAEKLIRRNLSKEDNLAIINESLKKVGSMDEV